MSQVPSDLLPNDLPQPIWRDPSALPGLDSSLFYPTHFHIVALGDLPKAYIAARWFESPYPEDFFISLCGHFSTRRFFCRGNGVAHPRLHVRNAARTRTNDLTRRASQDQADKVQGAQSLDRAVVILRIISEHDRSGIKPSMIARQAGLTNPTAHRILRALEQHGFVERDTQTLAYHLGPEIRILGTIVSTRFGIEHAAAPSLREIADRSGDTALLNVRRGAHSVILAQEEGTFPIRSQVASPGDAYPLGITSGGMAILATMSDPEVAFVLDTCWSEIQSKFPHYSRTLLAEQLTECRRSGYAVNPGLIITQSVGVAVAIRSPTGECLGALTVAGIDFRMAEPRRTELVGILRTEADKIYQRLTNPISTITPAL